MLLGFDDAPEQAANTFCGVDGEDATLQLQCVDPAATIAAIEFASYGTATGTCPTFNKSSCDSPRSMAVVAAACVGKHSCAVTVDNDNFGGDPCANTVKKLRVVARCSTGSGVQPDGTSEPKDRALLPPYVTSVRVVDYDGYCGTRFNWENSTADVRALQDPADSGRRALGLTQPCGCPTSPVDILLTDAAKAAGLRYRLSLYFVDYAPSPGCSKFDRTSRAQETYILRGYPDLSPLTERQYLRDFSGGVWLTYDLVGDARVRISSSRGDMAVLSALAFDAPPPVTPAAASHAA